MSPLAKCRKPKKQVCPQTVLCNRQSATPLPTGEDVLIPYGQKSQADRKSLLWLELGHCPNVDFARRWANSHPPCV